MYKALQGPVIQIDVTQLNVGIVQGFHIHAESMILGCDLYLAGCQVLYRLVSAAVPEFELKGLSTQGQPEQLMTKAYPEDGPLAYLINNCIYRVCNSCRVTRPVTQEEPLGLKPVYGLGINT